MTVRFRTSIAVAALGFCALAAAFVAGPRRSDLAREAWPGARLAPSAVEAPGHLGAEPVAASRTSRILHVRRTPVRAVPAAIAAMGVALERPRPIGVVEAGVSPRAAGSPERLAPIRAPPVSSAA